MNKQTKSNKAKIRSRGALYYVEKSCKILAPMDLPTRIFLDPKVKNGTISELKNGEKAIN